MPNWHSTALVRTAWVGLWDTTSLGGHLALGGTKHSLPGSTSSRCCHLEGMFSEIPVIQKATWIVRWAAAKQGEMSQAVGQTCMALERYCVYPERSSMWDGDARVKEGTRHFSRHGSGSSEETAGFCSALSKGRGKKKKKSPTHKQAPSTVWNFKAHKPLLERNEARGKSSRYDYRGRHSLNCSTSQPSALLQLFELHNIISHEPFIKTQF